MDNQCLEGTDFGFRLPAVFLYLIEQRVCVNVAGNCFPSGTVISATGVRESKIVNIGVSGLWNPA